jgi:hypothetical protein
MKKIHWQAKHPVECFLCKRGRRFITYLKHPTYFLGAVFIHDTQGGEDVADILFIYPVNALCQATPLQSGIPKICTPSNFL